MNCNVGLENEAGNLNLELRFQPPQEFRVAGLEFELLLELGT